MIRSKHLYTDEGFEYHVHVGFPRGVIVINMGSESSGFPHHIGVTGGSNIGGSMSMPQNWIFCGMRYK